MPMLRGALGYPARTATGAATGVRTAAAAATAVHTGSTCWAIKPPSSISNARAVQTCGPPTPEIT